MDIEASVGESEYDIAACASGYKVHEQLLFKRWPLLLSKEKEREEIYKRWAKYVLENSDTI